MAFNLFAHPAGHLPPHPTIEPRILRLIDRAVVKAWELVRTAPPPNFDIDSATEDEITAVLHNTLVNRVLYAGVVRGFTQALFRIAREPKVWSFDGTSLDKMPDLFFYLISDREVAFPDQDGIFAECKPVDERHTTGQHYCDRGLWRFINGDYAWAMQEGLMIGYAVDGYALPDELRASLQKSDRSHWMPLSAGPTAIPRFSATTYSQQPHVTTHPRIFNYSSGGGAPAIVMRHIWLTRD